ncbi:hypothetical protein HJA93_17230 [Rhizobium binae]|nr:hypothetical protein [Rhizobium binae]
MVADGRVARHPCRDEIGHQAHHEGNAAFATGAAMDTADILTESMSIKRGSGRTVAPLALVALADFLIFGQENRRAVEAEPPALSFSDS